MPKHEKGDVVLVSMSEQVGEKLQVKRRPAVIISCDDVANDVIVVPLTSSSAAAETERACIIVKMNSSEGRAAGLRLDSVIDCTVVATISKMLLVSKIGQFSEETMSRVDEYINRDSDNI